METNRIKKLVTLLSDAQSALVGYNDDERGTDDPGNAFTLGIIADIDRERASLCNLIERRELGGEAEYETCGVKGRCLLPRGHGSDGGQHLDGLGFFYV